MNYTQEQWDLLELKAENAVSDISNQLMADCMPSDEPNYEPDIHYDMYVESIGHQLYGVINMGDLYIDSFIWREGQWQTSTKDPHLLLNDILKKRLG